MTTNQPGESSTEKKDATVPAVSRCLPNGTMVELLYNAAERTTKFALWHDGQWTLESEVEVQAGERLVPFSPNNNIIKNDVVMLPSEPAEYGTKEILLADIQHFLHRYLDISPTFEAIVSHYVLFTWVYDAFNEVPYIRFQGDFGTGKTRALLVLGSVCYKAFFASGASTVSPLFHILDAFRGTLILDEADFRFSDEKAEIVKILNNGNVRGIPILRTMMNRQREFNPQAFQVFGPKIVATRSSSDDKGLESRFITEEMGPRKLRPDIPINLPAAMKEEARELRNKLLLYRFHRRFETKLDESLIDPKLEPRLNQILVPLLSVVGDPKLREDLRSVAAEAQAGLVAERGLLVEAQVLEILAELMAISERAFVPLEDVTVGLIERYGAEYERPITLS